MNARAHSSRIWSALCRPQACARGLFAERPAVPARAGLRLSAFALAMSCIAAPAAANDLQKTLYASDGPLVTGISYCYAVMSERENIDAAARKRGLQTPTDEFGQVYVLDRPDGKHRRVWQRTYTGAQAGKSGPPVGDDLSVNIRIREDKCEVSVSGVPKSYSTQAVPVTMQVFAKLDPSLKLDPKRDFNKVLVAGKGPSWHGSLWFNSEKYSGGVRFGIPAKGTAFWGVDLIRSDILKRKYGN